MPVAGRKRLGFSGPRMPWRSRSATGERALERPSQLAPWPYGRGTQSRGRSLDGHYVAPARSVTAKVPGINIEYRGSTSQIFGGGAWEASQDDI